MKNSKKIANINTIILENKLEADASVRPEHKENTQKGVTLLALIVTIIVLLILSLVSVQLVTKSGIIERVKQGVIQHKLQEIHENVKLDYISLKISRNLNVISMSDEIKDLQKKKYKKYIENVSYTSTKVFYKMTDKLDGKEYMIDIKTGEIGTYVDKLERIEGDSSLWIVQGSTIIGYKGTDDLLQNVVVPNIVKRDDGTEVKITNVSLSNINFEGTLTFASGLEINSNTLSNCSTVVNIVTGDNVSIKMGSTFSKCTKLEKVSMGRNAKIINFPKEFEHSLFNGCTGLKEIAVESLSEVNAFAFSSVGAALQGDIVINEGITSIGSRAFYNCSSITSVSIPSTVTNIGEYAFYNCSSIKTAKIPEGIKTIENGAFYKCSNLSDEIEIKEGVTLGGGTVFNNSGITKLTIGNNITIPSDSFAGCSNLAKVTIGNDVSIKMGSTFSKCTKLEEVSMGKNTKIINFYKEFEHSLFNGCTGLKKITVESLSEVNAFAFSSVGAALQGDIVINEGITSIGSRAFYNCSSITSVSIPSTVTNIGEYAFYNCSSIKTAKIPEGIKTIENGAFYKCSNLSDEIEIKEGVTLGGGTVFNNSGITQLTISNNIEIPGGSFEGCSNLEQVTIGDNVTIKPGGTWGNNYSGTFGKCTNLKNITIGENLKMPNNTWDAYWFRQCTSLEKITVKSISEIGQNAFNAVGPALQGEITINSDVTQIGDRAFNNCTGLGKINVNMTKTEWETVTKGSNWNTNVTAEIVFLK